MATPEEVFEGVATAMEDAVPDLTTALPRQADPADNRVEWPHGEILVVSNIRADQWNTDVVGYATDDQGNQIGYLLDARFDVSLQLNIWTAVPSDDWDIQSLGSQLERGMRKYDANRRNPALLPDGDGGALNDVKRVRMNNGGLLPTDNSSSSPLRGYQIATNIRFKDRIDTSEEYGEEDYVATVDTPQDGDLTDGGDSDSIAIEYNA